MNANDTEHRLKYYFPSDKFQSYKEFELKP